MYKLTMKSGEQRRQWQLQDRKELQELLSRLFATNDTYEQLQIQKRDGIKIFIMQYADKK